MKIRIKFAKSGTMKYIGHLDLMRFFQKALKRACIDVKFSEGMSPHMIMSFASPLGVGLTSCGEYVDVVLNTPLTTQQILDMLNAVMPEGMQILDARQIAETGKASRAMALVAAADYHVGFRQGYEPEEGWQESFIRFCSGSSILYEKASKSGSREIDLKPLIYELYPEETGIFMKISSGSAANLRPEQLFDAWYKSMGKELSSFALEICRRELYAQAEEGDQRRFVSLQSLGQTITEEMIQSCSA